MRDVRIDRRGFLRGVGGVAAGVAATSLTACGTGTSRSGAGGGKSSKKLVVRDSGGAYGEANKKAIYEPFTKETGIQIDVVNIQYAQMLAQIQQGRPQFEVIDDSMADFLRFQKADATEALDYDRLKNFKKAGIAKSLVTSNAVGKNYWASVMAFRTDVWGGKKPSSWADFWDTKAFPGDRALQALDADLPELEFALLADGVPMDKLYPLDVDRAFKSLSDIKGSVRKFWDTGALPGVLLGRKEVDASSVWHGRLDALIKGGSPLAYQWKGARRQSNAFGIPKGADNLDAAYKLIDFALRPEVQAQYAELYPMGPSVPAAYKKLSSATASNMSSSPEHLKTGFDLDVEWWHKHQDAVAKRWQEWTHD
ncbi:ABC transporter substrate-binding protein [Streptomyces sp. NBC_01795]|uniref:ABC transporter substrate-binding protein n=1 Tax=unclassified Streptomyces TaxID=2593676 RepID=UPI002DDC1F22|nr:MULTISPECIES: ABC transporter substrate-binding protein [unclassified Streptomyces]WSA91074.1 ABC transporter substrate-binding protein [Streptomyces sp. NBC_01795]WSB75399.1 ABC transporter substrate-binding protein [Streptomyces sp. NBC_01775]WSS16319.1 ABC transporter substrate-binding protein [Streptomyces sp. NBC_01186]